MNKKVWIPVLVSVFVAAAIFLSVGAYQVVNAAGFEQRWGGKGIGGPASEELAEALGVSVDELTAAHQQAFEAAVQQALDAGLITEAQAGFMRSSERIGMGMHFGGRMLESSQINFQALLADALGITVDELNAAQQAVHEARLAQAVAEGRITQEQADLMQYHMNLRENENFRSSMRSGNQAAVQQALEDGLITQEQAERMLSGEMGWRGRGGMHGGDGSFGGMRGFGGMGGRGSGVCPGAPLE
jgi:hypothetical protein